eukprot:gnl/Chilomastix_cuspidata/1296.p1 GENE.gnl/Chilomastix_cuspidata/1296~~gnl/Chilomastix_cuspidata/1296.p1  ORF type:complete len:431 (+),score=114.88 gnl/Chilomastix_cuspidata/1296:118-1293(+)
MLVIALVFFVDYFFVISPPPNLEYSSCELDLSGTTDITMIAHITDTHLSHVNSSRTAILNQTLAEVIPYLNAARLINTGDLVDNKRAHAELFSTLYSFNADDFDEYRRAIEGAGLWGSEYYIDLLGNHDVYALSEFDASLPICTHVSHSAAFGTCAAVGRRGLRDPLVARLHAQVTGLAGRARLLEGNLRRAISLMRAETSADPAPDAPPSLTAADLSGRRDTLRLEAEVRGLRAQLDSRPLAEDVLALSRKCSAAEAKVTELQALCIRFRKELGAARARLSAAQERLSAREADSAGLLARAASLEKAARDASEALSTRTRANGQLRSQLAQARDDIVSKTRENAALSHKVTALACQVEQARREGATARPALPSNEHVRAEPPPSREDVGV